MKTKLSKRIISILMAIFLLTTITTTAFAANIALIDETKTVDFTIHKFDIPSNATDLDTVFTNRDDGSEKDTSAWTYDPLPGVTFKLYKVGAAGTDPSTLSTATPADNVTPDFSGITNANGIIELTIPAADQGTYLVVEDTSTMANLDPAVDPAYVTTKTPNFLVSLPMTTRVGDTARTEWNYDVHVYPKNLTVLGAFKLTKTIDGQALTSAKGTATFRLEKLNSESQYVTHTASLSTDTNGILCINNLTAGSYRLIETAAPNNYGVNTTPIPFVINQNGSIHTTTYAETGTVVKETFDNKSTPTISKEVSVNDGATYTTDAGAKVGQDVLWKITPAVPADIATYSVYKITDTLNTALDFKSLVVYASADGELTDENEMTDDDSLYTFTKTGQALEVNFTAAGKTALTGKKLTIVLTTTINNTAVMGTAIPNKATLTYNNGYMPDDKPVDSGEPEVHTGGIKFIKYKMGTTTALEGAEFKLYTDAACTTPATDASGNALVATSGPTGTFEFKGLAYGAVGTANDTASSTYYMLETKSPSGYQLTNEVITITINKDSYNVDPTAVKANQIENAPDTQLPLTGGMGTTLFIAGGVLLIAGALFMFIKLRKSSKQK